MDSDRKTLQDLTKGIAIIHIGLSSISLILWSLSLGRGIYIYYYMDPIPFDPDMDFSLKTSIGEAIAVFQKYKIHSGIIKGLVYAFVVLTWLVFSFELLDGATELNRSKCNSWYKFQVAFMVHSIISVPIQIALSPAGTWFWLQLVGTPAMFIIILYCMSIVRAFMKVLQKSDLQVGFPTETA